MFGLTQRQCGRVSVVTPPTTLPLSVEEAKHHLRVSHGADDNHIEGCIMAALGEIDAPKGWLGRSLITRTLRLTLDAYPPSIVFLPGPPVASVSTIKVRNADDEIVTIYDAEAETDEIGLLSDFTAEPGLIWPSDDIGWPTDIKGGIDSMRIDYVAGYGATPPDWVDLVRQWLKIRTADYYGLVREGMVIGTTIAKNERADRMLDNLRVYA